MRSNSLNVYIFTGISCILKFHFAFTKVPVFTSQILRGFSHLQRKVKSENGAVFIQQQALTEAAHPGK